MKRIFLTTLPLLLSTTSFAMFCPNNFNQIAPGDTLDSVKQQCGDPQSEESKDIAPAQPQEWVYYLKTDPSNQMTTRITVGIENDKVANITISGLSVSTTQYCIGGSISVGDSSKNVTKVCGKPALVNQTNNNTPPGAPVPGSTKVTKLQYTTPTATITLTFENGILKK